MTIRPCEPDFKTIPSGVMALTPRDHPYKVGVWSGPTADEARKVDSPQRWPRGRATRSQERPGLAQNRWLVGRLCAAVS